MVQWFIFPVEREHWRRSIRKLPSAPFNLKSEPRLAFRECSKKLLEESETKQAASMFLITSTAPRRPASPCSSLQLPPGSWLPVTPSTNSAHLRNAVLLTSFLPVGALFLFPATTLCTPNNSGNVWEDSLWIPRECFISFNPAPLGRPNKIGPLLSRSCLQFATREVSGVWYGNGSESYTSLGEKASVRWNLLCCDLSLLSKIHRSKI